MSNTQLSVRQLPSITDLVNDLEGLAKQDALNVLLSQAPPTQWIKRHPFVKVKINGQSEQLPYIPIDKQRLIAKRIFGGHSVEILDSKVMFHSVVVTVRVTLKNPITGELMHHDGIGAMAVQTEAGASASDLSKIKSDSVMKAAPSAATYAEKNAFDKFGAIFGGELDKDTEQYTADSSIYGAAFQDSEAYKALEEQLTTEMKAANSIDDLRAIWDKYPDMHKNTKFSQAFKAKKTQLAYAK